MSEGGIFRQIRHAQPQILLQFHRDYYNLTAADHDPSAYVATVYNIARSGRLKTENTV
jgi:hypothetical protein